MSYLFYIAGKMTDVPYWGELTPLSQRPPQPDEAFYFTKAKVDLSRTDIHLDSKVRATHGCYGFPNRGEMLLQAYGLERWMDLASHLCQHAGSWRVVITNVQKLKRWSLGSTFSLPSTQLYRAWWSYSPECYDGQAFSLAGFHSQVLEQHQHFMAFLDTALQWSSPVICLRQ